MSNIKIWQSSYAKVNSGKNGAFIFKFAGFNSKDHEASAEIEIYDWQINAIIIEVGKIHRQRLQYAQNDLEEFKNAVKDQQ